MTEQEAIEAIKNDLEWHKKELKPKYRECLNMAIKALEKQIPKKPLIIGKVWDKGYECPICDSSVTDHYDCKLKYCRECGQKILWEDE